MTQNRDIQALLSHLSEDELALFEGYVQQQLDEALALADDDAQGSPTGAADPLQVEADLIEEIALLAEGRSPERPGIGFVPIPGGEIHVVPPQRNPFDAALSPAGTAGGPPAGMTMRRRILLAAGVLGVAMLLMFFSLRNNQALPMVRHNERHAAAPSPLPGAAGATGDPNAPELEQIGPVVSPAPIVEAQVRRAKASYPSSLEIVLPAATAWQETASMTSTAHAALVYRVVPSTGELGGTWQPERTPGTAAWLASSYVNSVFCLPADTAATLEELPVGTEVLMRPATGDVRTYEIVRVREIGRQQTEVMSQRKAGLTLIACNASGDRRMVAEAVYVPPITREPAPLAALGSEIPDYVRVQVQTVEAVPLADPNVVRLEVGVTLHNLSTGELHWTNLTDRLLIGGQAAQPAGRTEWAPLAPEEARTETYSYVVPRSTQSVLWQVLAPTGEGVDLQMAVPLVEE